MLPQNGENTSGGGVSATIPPEIRGWNWGAFFLNAAWGVFNGTYVALLAIVPVLNVIMPFVLGAKGNRWAWQNKRWESVEQFKRVQRKWAIAGLVLFIVPLGIFGYFLYIISRPLFLINQQFSQTEKESAVAPNAPPYKPPSPPVSPTNTDGWSTYTSSEYGFSVLYPQNFKASGTGNWFSANPTREGSLASLYIQAFPPVPPGATSASSFADSVVANVRSSHAGYATTSSIKFLGYDAIEIYIADNQLLSRDTITFQSEKMIYDIARMYNNGMLKGWTPGTTERVESKGDLADNETIDKIVGTMKLIPIVSSSQTTPPPTIPGRFR